MVTDVSDSDEVVRDRSIAKPAVGGPNFLAVPQASYQESQQTTQAFTDVASNYDAVSVRKSPDCGGTAGYAASSSDEHP